MWKYFYFVVILELLTPASSKNWWSRFVKKGGMEAEIKHGWIRACTKNGDFYQTFARTCPKGLFLKEPLVPGCVCMHGPWVLHSTLCDPSPYIFYGEKDEEQCYQIDFNITMFIYLGDVLDITKSRAYVAPNTLTVFHEIKENSTTPYIDFHWPTVLLINPKKKFIHGTEINTNKSICFSYAEYVRRSQNVKGHLWNGDRGPTAYKMVDSCDGYRFGGYDDLVGTNNDFFYRSNKVIPVPYAPCSSECKIRAHEPTTTRNPYYNEYAEYPDEPFQKYNPNSRSLRRLKRYKTRDTVETTWRGLGFCMQSFWDPLLEFEMVTEEENWCYPQHKGVYNDKLNSKSTSSHQYNTKA